MEEEVTVSMQVFSPSLNHEMYIMHAMVPRAHCCQLHSGGATLPPAGLRGNGHRMHDESCASKNQLFLVGILNKNKMKKVATNMFNQRRTCVAECNAGNLMCESSSLPMN